MLPQIRKRRNKAIIVDVTGQFVSKYFNPGTDVIFNPLDARSVEWSIWEDCRTDYHFEAFAESIIPPQKNQGEDIWDKSSRIVLVELLKKLKEQQTPFVKELLNVINTYTLEGFGELLAGTNAAKILSKEGERTSHSVLMNLIAHIAPLKILHDGERSFLY